MHLNVLVSPNVTPPDDTDPEEGVEGVPQETTAAIFHGKRNEKDMFNALL